MNRLDSYLLIYIYLFKKKTKRESFFLKCLNLIFFIE